MFVFGDFQVCLTDKWSLEIETRKRQWLLFKYEFATNLWAKSQFGRFSSGDDAGKDLVFL